MKKKSIFFAIYCTAIIVFLTLFLIFYVPNSKEVNNHYIDNVQTNEQGKPGEEDSTENDSDSELNDNQTSNTNDEKPNNNEGSIGSDDSDNENNNIDADADLNSGANEPTIDNNDDRNDNIENNTETGDNTDSSSEDNVTVGEGDTETEDSNANNNDNAQSPPTASDDNNSTDSDNENNQSTPEYPDSPDSNLDENQDKNESNENSDNQSNENKDNSSSIEQKIFLYDSNGNLIEDNVIYTNNKSFSFAFKIKSTEGESIIQEVECELYSDNASLVLNSPPLLILYFRDYGSATLKITSLYDDSISCIITIIYQQIADNDIT